METRNIKKQIKVIMNKVSQINVMLGSLSYEELKEVNRNLAPLLKQARKEIAADMRYMLSKGDKVRVNHRRLNGKTLTVEKVNRVKAVLRESSKGPSWTVPLSLIEPVEFKVDMVQLEQGRRVA